MISQLSNVFENSRKTGFSDSFSDGKLAEISRYFESTASFVIFTCPAPLRHVAKNIFKGVCIGIQNSIFHSGP